MYARGVLPAAGRCSVFLKGVGNTGNLFRVLNAHCIELHHSSGSVAGVITDPKERRGDRHVRALLAALLAVVAVSTLRKRKRNTGLLALVGAFGFGFNAATSFCGMNRALGIDSTTDE